MKASGQGVPLLTRRDLDTMFGMFDITHKGTVTAEQANQVSFGIWHWTDATVGR
jgi:hypothetical protein